MKLAPPSRRNWTMLATVRPIGRPAASLLTM
jgi:hypothetical protein